MKSDYNFLVTKNHNKLVNVTGWQTRVYFANWPVYRETGKKKQDFPDS